VEFEVEGMDRMYLKMDVPPLQAVEGALKFIRIQHGHQVVSTAMVQPITRQFVDSIWAAAQRTSALRFADSQVQALGRAFLLFQMLPVGFSDRETPATARLSARATSAKPMARAYDLAPPQLDTLDQEVPACIQHAKLTTKTLTH
jgi:hypothetical protein